jgi:hypothetical protein
LEQEQQGINQKAGRAAAWDQSSKLTFLSKRFRQGLVFIQVLTFLHDDEIKWGRRTKDDEMFLK